MPAMTRLPLLLLVACLGVGASTGTAEAATCGDYPDQAEAQRAADTRDPDDDRIYCENLPCPCLRPGGTSPPPSTPPATTPRRTCSRPATVQRLRFDATKYANIKRHAQAAIAKGWPRILVGQPPQLRRAP